MKVAPAKIVKGFLPRHPAVCSTICLWMVSLPWLSSMAFAQSGWDTSAGRVRTDAALSPGSDWQGSDWLGTAQNNRPKWNLGVTGDATELGVAVQSVAPNGAAQRAGIEVGDVIINVDGFQVGMVEGRLYDLNSELTRRADLTGAVALLVQDRRTLRLARVRVQLDGDELSLQGNLLVDSRNPIPSDAIVTVQIENLTRPYYRVHRGQTSFRAQGGTSVPFKIHYDPAYIYPQDTYQVRAFVTANGRTVLDTPVPQTVLTRGNPSRVNLRLQRLPQTGLVSNDQGTPGVVTAGYPNFNQIDEQFTAMYRHYLSRDPQPIELAVLHNTPSINERLRTFPLELMAGQEYFDAAGNNNQVWFEKVFEEIVKKRPSDAELAQWMQRYAELGYSRTELLRQLYSQARG